jgi:phage baseplate assembly protein W
MDLDIGPTGDLAVVSGTPYGQQRVLRRLLTSIGDYIWQPSYGAGLPQFVGQPVSAPAIAGVVREQMKLEAAVAQTPEPVITVTDNRDGSVFCDIKYVDADSSQTVILQFPISST